MINKLFAVLLYLVFFSFIKNMEFQSCYSSVERAFVKVQVETRLYGVQVERNTTLWCASRLVETRYFMVCK